MTNDPNSDSNQHSAPTSPGVSHNVYIGPRPRGPSNGQGVAAGVLGIVGMGLFWVPLLGGLLCLLALVFGGVGLSQGRKENLPTGMAITGIVLGAVGVGIYVIVTLLLAGITAGTP